MDVCPYCANKLHLICLDNVQGRRWYYECFDCGWCSEEYYSDGFDFEDPDKDIDEKWVSLV